LDTWKNKNATGDALLRYSQHQVPEEHALYRLSFPPPPRSTLGGFHRLLQTALVFTWVGKALQVELTMSLESFADWCRDRQAEVPFPDAETGCEQLATLHFAVFGTCSSSSSDIGSSP